MIEYTCPKCGKVLAIPEEYAGKAGRCRYCNTKFVVEVRPPAAPSALETESSKTSSTADTGVAKKRDDSSLLGRVQRAVSRRLRAKTLYEQKLKGSVPIEMAISGFAVEVDLTETGELVLSIGNEIAGGADGGDQHQKDVVTPSQVKDFMRLWIETSIGPKYLISQRASPIEIAFEAWRCMHGKRDKNGKLKESMRCTGFSQHTYRCDRRTKDPSGLCQNHKKPGSQTMWNCDWYSGEEIQQRENESRRKVEAEREERQKHIDEERVERERKWADIAASIDYTATDRQIYFLLDLGASPKQLQGIDKGQASKMIDKLLRH